ncbi:MAG: PA14 domain-containing protein [Victivallales bacterium]
MLRNKILPVLAVFGLLFFLPHPSAKAQAPTAPENPDLYQATFTKVIFSWLPSTDDTGVTGYRIYRDGAETGTSADTEYTDTGLLPDSTYVYTVKAFDAAGNLSLPSPDLTVRTLKNLDVENAAVVQQIVDSTDPFGLSAENLILSVQDAFTALGHAGIDFTQIDVPILSGFIDRELAVINEAAHPASDAERIADRQELDQIMLASFPGHSFAELYLQCKLVELGEEHWQKGHPAAAETLYEYSLNFMSDHEVSVFNTLNRLAMFKHSIFNTYATRLELNTSLSGYRSQLMRYFDFFPGSTSDFAERIHYGIAGRYFCNFPELLYYDSYEQSAFDSALGAIQAAKALQDIKRNQTKLARISAWELKSVKVSFKTPDGIPMSGMVDIVNTNGADVYPKTPAPSDSRRFTLVNGEVTIPVYRGHAYSMTAIVNVQGGPAIRYTVSNVKHENGFIVTCDHGQASTVSSLSDPNATGEVLFISGQPTSPYNLAAARYVDTFTLSWDWVAPSENYSLKNFKVFRGGIEIGSVTAQSLANIPLESENHTYSYTAVAYDVNDIPSDESLPLQVIPNFTGEQNAYFAWKQSYFGNQPMYDYEDPDNDGLTNYQEYVFGSNPTLAPAADVKATLQGVTPGISVKYYQGTWTQLPDFTALTPASSEVRSSPSFTSTTGNILSSGMSDFMGASFSGYLDIPSSGFYRFYLTSDEGSRLYIDNLLFIDNGGKHTSREYNADMYMKQGVHQIRLDYFEYESAAVLKLEWAGPGFVRKNLDSSDLWICAAPTPLLEETIAWNRDSDRDNVCNSDEILHGTNPNKADSDNDGLGDYEELNIYHTDPNLADTDGDGMSDYEEAKVTFTDPFSADFNGTCTSVLTASGSQGVAAAGEWLTQGTAIYATSRNGTVEYALNVPAAGVYRLEVEGTRHNCGTTQSSFLLELLMDGSSCGSQTLTASYGVNGRAWFYLPKLQSGIHSAKIRWTNVASNTFLRINKLELQSLGGPDTDSNGIPDWIDSRNEALTLVTVPASSKTSPLCIEGANASNIEQIAVAGFYTKTGDEPVEPAIRHSVENGWYSDVTLTPNAPSNLTISFQNGQLSVNRTTTWLPVNIITGDDMNIRLNDSLLLTAAPEGSGQGSVSITVEGQTFTTTSDAPLPYKFENTGDIQISATFTPDGGGTAVTDSLNVKVVSGSFNGNPVCFFNEPRLWDNPGLDDLAVVKYDRNVNMFESDLTPGRRLDIRALQNVPGYVIARLGQDGPIMANASVKIMSTLATYSYLDVVESYADGSIMVESQICLSTVPPDFRVHLRIFVGGVTFDDGTIERWVTAADFDEYGVYKYRMHRAPGAYTGNCHSIQFYQGNALMKTY